MRDIRTRHLKTAMHNIAMRIRTDLVLHVAFAKTPTGGCFYLWVTQAGDPNTVEWSIRFYEGLQNEICLPKNLTEEK